MKNHITWPLSAKKLQSVRVIYARHFAFRLRHVLCNFHTLVVLISEIAGTCFHIVHVRLFL